MTDEFKKLIQDLQNNSIVISEFLASPEDIIAKYNISDQEKKTLLARDIDGLNNLGLTTKQAVGALSGSHGCNAHVGM